MRELPLLSVQVRYEQDVVLARQRVHQIAALLGYDALEQTRLATAASEIVRNAYQYAGGGSVEFALAGDAEQSFQIRVRDRGPGIKNLAQVLEGQYSSPTGLGMGILGARRLSDRFEIDSSPTTGTTVVLGRSLPRGRVLGSREVGRIAEELARQRPGSPVQELRDQNQELLRALEALRTRQQEVERLNRELEETNRGVMALYAELDEKAGYLARLNEAKTRSLSHLSHELRTPLNAIQNLSRLLLTGLEGELSTRQQRPVEMIRSSAAELTELVSDWLDLAKIEAGKIEVKVKPFTAADLLGALRALFRPWPASEAVTLVFEEPQAVPPLCTDEGKVAQILRNFISNALKYTERGEVRISVRGADGLVHFAVQDTGIGIEPAYLPTIFEEFTQVDHPLQGQTRGTGLGLPLSRKLATLLGGDIRVQSTPGVGSVFTLSVPAKYAALPPALAPGAPAPLPGPTR